MGFCFYNLTKINAGGDEKQKIKLVWPYIVYCTPFLGITNETMASCLSLSYMLFSVLINVSLLVTSMVVAEDEIMVSTCAVLVLPVMELTDRSITITLSTRDDGSATSKFFSYAVEPPNKGHIWINHFIHYRVIVFFFKV